MTAPSSPSSNQDYLGLSLADATSAATAAGLRSRHVSADGVHKRVTKDYRPKRLNFTTEKGIVTKVTNG